MLHNSDFYILICNSLLHVEVVIRKMCTKKKRLFDIAEAVLLLKSYKT